MPGELYLRDAIKQFRELKALADKAVARISDDDLYYQPDPGSNSIAVCMIHMAGNMRSRWTDLLTTDGEKPDRHRDTEFEIGSYDTREKTLARWEEGWRILFAAIEPLTPANLKRKITIRSEPLTILEAINRQLTHYAAHVGQIIYIARHRTGRAWKSLSVPRGQSDKYQAKMQKKWESK